MAGPEDTCGPRDEIVAKAAAVFGEMIVNRAVTAEGGMIEVLASPSGSYTIIITGASKKPYMSCVAMSGEDWRTIEAEWGDRL